MQAHLVPTYDELGELDGAVGVATDITELARAQAQLSESEARHSVVLDALHEGVLMVDRLGRVLSANPAAQRILDPDGAELVGSTIGDPGWQVVHEDGSPMASSEFPVSVTLATGAAVLRTRSWACTGPDGTHTWISVNTQGVFQPRRGAAARGRHLDLRRDRAPLRSRPSCASSPTTTR